MRRHLLPLALLLALPPADVVPQSVAGGARPAPTIRVLTYNIHHGEGSDGQLDLVRIAGVIAEASPDLVALQEVDEMTERSGRVRQASELGRLTGLRPVFGQAMPYQGGGYGVGILSRWPPSAVSNRPLPGQDGREPRTALTVTVRPAADAPPITFTSTHLDFGRGDFRDAQAQALNDTLASDDRTLAILAGDMNSGEDSEVLRILHERWQEIVVPGPTAMNGSGRLIYRLDYLFVRPAPRWRVLESRRIEALTASDHLPVLAVISLIDTTSRSF